MATITTTELSFSTTTDEEKAKAAAAGQIVFVEPSENGGTGKIYMGGKKFGGGGSDTPCEDEKMPASTTSNKAIMLPIGTDISGLSALDILKKILMATYMPYWKDASINTAATYTKRIGGTQLSGNYVIADISKIARATQVEVSAVITITGDPAYAKSSSEGSVNDITYTANGGDLYKTVINGATYEFEDNTLIEDDLSDLEKECLTSKNTNSVVYTPKTYVSSTQSYIVKTINLMVDDVKAFTTASFADVGLSYFAQGARTSLVKDSSGTVTNKTASVYNSETGTANSNINDNGRIKEIGKYPTGYVAAKSHTCTVYGYLPIFFQKAMEFDGTPGTSTPSGAAPAGAAGEIAALSVSGNTVSDSKQPTEAQTYNTETNANGYYYKVKMPAATSTIPWQVLIPDGYNISSFYIKNVGGNWESTTSAMLSKTSTYYTIYGHTYYLWQGALGASKQPVAFKIKKG